MELTDDDIREFQKIWIDEFKEALSEADARTHATQILELYARLAEAQDGMQAEPYGERKQ